MPSRFVYADWALLYSTAVHGISLNTFYANSAGCGCCVLALKDESGNVFGGFCTECAASHCTLAKHCIWELAMSRSAPNHAERNML